MASNPSKMLLVIGLIASIFAVISVNGEFESLAC